MKNPPHAPLIKILTRVRNSRLVWDVMGSIYNRGIYEAIAELYDHIARELETPGQALILDVGAGRGYMSLLLASNHPDYILAYNYL